MYNWHLSYFQQCRTTTDSRKKSIYIKTQIRSQQEQNKHWEWSVLAQYRLNQAINYCNFIFQLHFVAKYETLNKKESIILSP